MSSLSREKTKRTTKSNQVISTYNLRPRGKKQDRSSSTVPPNSSKSPSVQKRPTKKIKRNSRKNNNEENTRQSSDRFIMPSPKRITDCDLNEFEIDFLGLDELELDEIELFNDENIDEVREVCPFCKTVLPSLKSDKVKSALEYNKKGKISALEFCIVHSAEVSVIQDGVEKNYPSVINFDELPDRIHKFKDNLMEIINGTTDSYYRDYAIEYYNENGHRKSSSSSGLLSRFEDLRAGYYGAKGTIIISDVLIRLFLTPCILTKENTSPLDPMKYILEVLVPETALRLIFEDIGGKGSLEAARKIMVSSSNFGYLVHNDGNV